MRPAPPDPSRFQLEAGPHRSNSWSLNQHNVSSSSSRSSHKHSLSSSSIYSSKPSSSSTTTHGRQYRQVHDMPRAATQHSRTPRRASLAPSPGVGSILPQISTRPVRQLELLLDSTLSPVLESPASSGFGSQCFPSRSAEIRGSPVATSSPRPVSVHRPSPYPCNNSGRPLSVASLASAYSYDSVYFSTPRRDSVSGHSRSSSSDSSSSSMSTLTRSHSVLLPIGRKTKHDVMHERQSSMHSPKPSPLPSSLSKPSSYVTSRHAPEPKLRRATVDYRGTSSNLAIKGLGLTCDKYLHERVPSRLPPPTDRPSPAPPTPEVPTPIPQDDIMGEGLIESVDVGGNREARRRRRQGVDFHSNAEFSVILDSGFDFNGCANVGEPTEEIQEIVEQSPDLRQDCSWDCYTVVEDTPQKAGAVGDDTDAPRESRALHYADDAKGDTHMGSGTGCANPSIPSHGATPQATEARVQEPCRPPRPHSPQLPLRSSFLEYRPPSHLNPSVSSLKLNSSRTPIALDAVHSLSMNDLLPPNAEFTGTFPYDVFDDFAVSRELEPKSAFDSDTDQEDEPSSSSPQHRRYIMGSPRKNFGRDNSNHIRSPSVKFKRLRNALRGSISVGNVSGKIKRGVIPPDSSSGPLGTITDSSASGDVRQDSRIQPPLAPFHAHATSTSSIVTTLPAPLATFSASERGPRPGAGKIGGAGNVTTPVDADGVMLLGFQQERCMSDTPLATRLIDHSGTGSPGTSAHPRSSSIPELPESCCQSAKVLISGQSPTSSSPSELGSPPDFPLPPTPPTPTLPPSPSLSSNMHFSSITKLLLPHPYLTPCPSKTLENDEDPFYGDSREIVDVGGGCRLSFVDPEESIAKLELSMAKLHMYAPDGTLRKSANLHDWVQIVVKEVQGSEHVKNEEETARQEPIPPRKPAVSLTPSTFARLELCAPIAIPPLDFPEDSDTIRESPSPSGKRHGRQPSLDLLPAFDFEKPKRPIKWSCAKQTKLARRTSSLINLRDLRVHSHGVSSGSPTSSSGFSSMTDLPGSSTCSESTYNGSPVRPRHEPKEGTPSKTVPFLLRPVRHDRLHASPSLSLSAPNSPTKNTRHAKHSHDLSHHLLDEDTETDTITPSSLAHSFAPSSLAESYLQQSKVHSDRSSKVRRLWERVGVRTERSVRSLRGGLTVHV